MRNVWVLLLLAYIAAAQADNASLEAQLRATKRNPELLVDLNRAAVINLIVAKWPAELGDQDAAVHALHQLRGDQLYRAAIANTFTDVMSATADMPRSARAQQKALGDSTGDFSYTPVTPCRLVETRGSFPAVYRGDGTPAHNALAFAPGEIRNYTIQSGNGVCLSQLPNGLTPTAVVLSVFGIPTTAGSGDIEILPQSPPANFGSTDTVVFLGNTVADNAGNSFTSAGTIVQVNQNNNQIGVQVRISPAHVAIDIVGYFKQAIGRPAGLLRITQPGSIAGDPAGVGTLPNLTAGPCPAGKMLVSGGCSSLVDTTYVNITSSDADPNTGATWMCSFANFSSQTNVTKPVSASAYCMDIPARSQ